MGVRLVSLTILAWLTACEHVPPPPGARVIAAPPPVAAPAEVVELPVAPWEPPSRQRVSVPDFVFGDPPFARPRTTTLRMSLPVAAVEGERSDDGFSVTFRGALSLDRAGPIAAANPSVERAAILNHGDHATLMVRFVPGVSPPFRVEVAGAIVSVHIGRPGGHRP